MFFREKRTPTTPVLQLVESRREADGQVRQHLIVSLGGCWVPDELRKAVAVAVTHRLAGYERIRPADPEVAEWTRRVLAKLDAAGRLAPPKLSRGGGAGGGGGR